MSQEWNKLSESAKAPYVKQAEHDKARYEKEKKEYEKTGGAGAKEAKHEGKQSAGKKSVPKSGKKSAKQHEEDEK
jgi:hypothetical protein